MTRAEVFETAPAWIKLRAEVVADSLMPGLRRNGARWTRLRNAAAAEIAAAYRIGQGAGRSVDPVDPFEGAGG